MVDIDELIAELKQATGSNRHIDGDIAEFFKLPPFGYNRWPLTTLLPARWQNGINVWDAPDYTKSIDAALTLVPEGFNGSVAFGKHSGAILWERDPKKHLGEHRAKTPALALCIAALRARTSTTKGDK